MKFLLYFIAVAITFLACKKKGNTEPTPAPNTTGNTTYYTYGSMELIYYQYYTGNTFTYNDSAASAVFFSDPANPLTSTLNAGIVSLNSDTFPSANNYYSSFNVNVHRSNSVWAVSGSSVVPAMNYTATPNFPIFSGNSQLPDSFSISSGVTIALSGISNFGTNSIFVQIYDNIGASVSKTIQPGSFSCQFSNTDLATLQPSNYAMIMVNLGNSTIWAFGGKDYGIGCMLNHTKSGIKIKP